MGITQLPPPAAQRSASHAEAFISGGAYSLLFLLGLAEGLLGSFQHSRAVIGGVPLGAIGFAVAIFITCALAGRAMRALPGALLPAVGWFVATFGLAMPNTGGSVIIANTAPGGWYLYGGAVCALLGIATALVASVRLPSRSRPAGGDGSRA